MRPVVPILAAVLLAACPSEEGSAPPADARATSPADPAPAPPRPRPRRGSVRDPRVLAAARTLEAHVRRWALADPEDTWALAHGITALGPDVRLPDGRSAVEAVLSHATVREVAGRAVPGFVGDAPSGTPREPHRTGTLAMLAAAGVPLDRAFVAGGRRFAVGDLLEGSLWLFEPPPDDDWGRYAWTLSAAAGALRTGAVAPSFENAWGARFDLRALAGRLTDRLEARTAFLSAARAAGRAPAKRRQGIWAEPCGGLHLVGAAAAWLPDPEVGPALRPRLQEAARILEYRLGLERRIYRQARRQAPTEARRVAIQELKFYGHWLQVAAALRDGGVEVAPEAVDEARNALVDTVRRLERQGAFEQMERIRKERPQTYLDLIGDAAHALAGLGAWQEG